MAFLSIVTLAALQRTLRGMISINHMKKIILFFVISLAIIGVVFVLEAKGILTWRLELGKKPSENVEVVFMDVGQGDAALLKFPSGQTMLVDCGKDASILSALGRNLSWFKRDLDYLVISHPHADHFGGCLDVLARFKVHHIYVNGYNSGGQLLENFNQAVKYEAQGDGAENIILSQPQTIEVGSTTIRFLYPDHELSRDPRVPASKESLDINDTSVVIKVSHGTQDILLTGDMEKPLERHIIKTNPGQLNSEILKVGHHGSDSSSSEEFVEAVKPKFCIVSSGEGNSYGHPHGSTVRRLERMGCQVLRTDQRGDILMTLTTSTSYLEQ